MITSTWEDIPVGESFYEYLDIWETVRFVKVDETGFRLHDRPHTLSKDLLRLPLHKAPKAPRQYSQIK